MFFFAPAPGKGRGRRSPVGRRHGARAKTQGVFFLLRPRRKAGEGEAPLGAGTGPEQKNKHHPGCVFFFTAAEGKGRRSSVGRRHGARAKKNTPPRVFFFLAPAPGKGRGRRSPVGRRHGARAKKKNKVFFFAPALGAGTGPEQKKKHHPGCFFFAPAPGKGRGRRSFVGRQHGARAKKKTPPRVFFFLLRPRGKAGEGEASLGAGTGPEQKINTTQGVFFCSGLGRRHGARAKKKKNTQPGCFFCSGPGARQGKEKPRWAPARGQSKNPGCFFFAPAPEKGRGRRSAVGRRHGARAKK